MPESKYSRKTVLAAAQVLKSLGHSGFDGFMLEILPPDAGVGQGGSLMDKANSLVRYALQDSQRLSVEDKNLWDEIVERAVREDSNFPPHIDIPNVKLKEREDLHNAVATRPLNSVAPQAPTKSKIINPLFMPIKSPVHKSSASIDHQTTQFEPETKMPDRNRVFIVHGRDEAPKEAVARFIERLGFEAVILHERVNGGKTIIEKFIANSDVHFAVVLLTPDDVGGLVGAVQEPRARQNVIIEWGIFIGALGRENVMALMKGDVVVPSDALGLVWEALDQHGAWKQKLAKEMNAAGFKINWEKVSA